MIILKIVFTFWCIAMLMSVILIFTGLFGLVPAEVVDLCARLNIYHRRTLHSVVVYHFDLFDVEVIR